MQTKDELRQILNDEAENISDAIKIAIKNNTESAQEIEDNILEKLVALSYLTSHIEEHDNTKQNIKQIADDFDIDLVVIFNEDLKIISSNIELKESEFNYLNNSFSPVLNGEYLWQEIGFVDIDNKEYYVIAYERLDNDGVIICGLSSDKALSIRKKYGIGALLQNFVQKDNIKYIIIQDTFGIYAAAGKLPEIDLTRKSVNDNNAAQIINLDENRYFEHSSELIQNEQSSILTLAIDTKKSSSIQQKTVFRAVILIIGIIIVYFVIIYLMKISNRNVVLENQNQQFSRNLEFILNNLNDAVITFDVATKKIDMINKSAKEMLKLMNLESGIEHDSIFKNDEFSVSNSIINNDAKVYDETSILNNDIRKYFAYSHSFIEDEYNDRKLLMLVIKDITEIKLSQELIQRKSRLDAMSNLAAGVAHEIRNPLNSISIIVQRFKFEFVPESDKDEYIKLVNTVRNEIDRLNSIITQFLDYAKPKPLSMEKIFISDLIKEIYDLYKTKCERNNIELIFKKCEKCLITGDKNKLKQVIINILQNALDEQKNGGKIIITNKIESNFVIIDIADNGKGVDDNSKQKIFDLYYTTKSKGNGIGLSIVQQIIDEHKGNISVLDNHPKGAIFRIKIPVQK
jgi:signal transduction histidine kinase